MAPTIIIEDGNGQNPLANSYVTLEETNTYFVNRGYTDWADGDDDLKTFAILNACAYMELLDWKGVKSIPNWPPGMYYPLAWPRRGMFDRDGYTIWANDIPKKLKYAQMEIALRLFRGKNTLKDLTPDGDYIVHETVGPIDIDYSPSMPLQEKWPEVDRLLLPWLNSSVSVQIERS